LTRHSPIIAPIGAQRQAPLTERLRSLQGWGPFSRSPTRKRSLRALRCKNTPKYCAEKKGRREREAGVLESQCPALPHFGEDRRRLFFSGLVDGRPAR
jgi:hypothetical protein